MWSGHVLPQITVQGYLTDFNASGYPEKFSESCVAKAGPSQTAGGPWRHDVILHPQELKIHENPVFKWMKYDEMGYTPISGNLQTFTRPKPLRCLTCLVRSCSCCLELSKISKKRVKYCMLCMFCQTRSCTCGTNSQECYDPLFEENFCYPLVDFWLLGHSLLRLLMPFL